MSNEHTNLLTDHTLTNSTEKKIQSGIIEMELSNHELIYCSRKMSFLKLNDNQGISVTAMKNNFYEIFAEQSRSIKFPYYSNYTM